MYLKSLVCCTFYLFILHGIAHSQLISSASEAFGDQLVIGEVGKVPEHLNPYRVDNVITKRIVRLIFGSGLLQQSDRFGNPPAIVDRFLYSGSNQAQGIVWKYVLKRNINFQNGIPLRNDDVLFSFNLLRKWGGYILNRELDFSNIKSIETSGDLEIQFTLKSKDNNFDRKLSDVPILSKDYYRDAGLTGIDELNRQNPMGYGPFRLESTSPNRIVLSPHPHYAFGRPFLNHIVFRFFPDEQQMIDAFIQGELDLIEVNDRITARRLHQILKNEIKIFPTIRPEKKVYFVLLNQKQFPFKDLKVRIALRGGINALEILNRMLDQSGNIAYSLVDVTSPSFYKQLIRDNYNPATSLRILTANGWRPNRSNGILEKDGRELSFELLFEQNSYLEENIARAIKIHLAEIGINVQPKPVSMVEKQKLIHTNNFEASIQNFSYLDMDLYSAAEQFYYHVLKNDAPGNYSNWALESLFKNSENSSGVRDRVIHRFQIALHQDVPVIFLYFDDKIIYAVSNRFRDIRVSSLNSGNIYYHRLNPFENWYVPKPLQKY